MQSKGRARDDERVGKMTVRTRVSSENDKKCGGGQGEQLGRERRAVWSAATEGQRQQRETTRDLRWRDHTKSRKEIAS